MYLRLLVGGKGGLAITLLDVSLCDHFYIFFCDLSHDVKTTSENLVEVFCAHCFQGRGKNCNPVHTKNCRSFAL